MSTIFNLLSAPVELLRKIFHSSAAKRCTFTLNSLITTSLVWCAGNCCPGFCEALCKTLCVCVCVFFPVQTTLLLFQVFESLLYLDVVCVAVVTILDKQMEPGSEWKEIDSEPEDGEAVRQTGWQAQDEHTHTHLEMYGWWLKPIEKDTKDQRLR